MRLWCVSVTAFFALGALLVAILVPLSMRRVSYDEVGLRYDTLSHTMGLDLLREGLHDLGPSGTLLTLKTTQRDVEFKDFAALTLDGLTVSMDISVTYAVITAEIFIIFDEYGSQEEHDDYIRVICEQRITDVSTKFNASDFYLERQSIQTALQLGIQELFQTHNSHATLYFAQIVNIDLPDQVQNALLQTTFASQDIQNALGERGRDVQQAQIAYDLAVSQANLVILSGQLEASKIDQQSIQDTQAVASKLELRTYAFSNISAGLGGDGVFFIESYLKPLVLTQNTGKTVINL